MLQFGLDAAMRTRLEYPVVSTSKNDEAYLFVGFASRVALLQVAFVLSMV
mgnify:CR=1 FL=1